MQGCSTLWNAQKLEERGEAGDGGTEAVLGERAATISLEDVEGEAAETGEDARVAADARAILTHGDVAAVVRGVLDGPVVSDGGGGALGWDDGRGEVESGLGGAAPVAGAGAAGEDVALDADDGADEAGPVGIAESLRGLKDGDAAVLLAVAPLIAAAGRGERGGGGA